MFVDTQQRCDTLFMELVRAGYSGLTLHGGKDQYDRDQVCVEVLRGLLRRAAIHVVRADCAGLQEWLA